MKTTTKKYLLKFVCLLLAFGLTAGCDLFGDDNENVDTDRIPDISPIPDTAGAVRLLVPEDSQIPFVGEFFMNYIPQDGELAGLIFLRETNCIPEFNMLDQPPIPGEAFGCPLTIESVTYWYDPSTDPFPFYEVRQGTGATPVWFVDWSELQTAIADDELTIGELEQLPSLVKGIAEEYDAQIVFSNNQDGIPAQSEQLASGKLADGREFRFFFAERLVEGGNEITDIEIKFD